jgi:phospholipid/cholesterol/gamma-HCH transport system substrate-binding protein
MKTARVPSPFGRGISVGRSIYEMAFSLCEVKVSENKQDNEFKLPRRSFSVEFWVGVFAIIGVWCFAYLAINIARMKITNSGYYQVTAVFSDISGLKVGSSVEIAGVQVGDVAAVDLNSTEAKVTLQIRDDVKLRDDDIAQIRTKGIIGDKYVRVSPGGSEKTVAKGGQLSDTESAVDFEEIVGKLVHSLEK